MRIKNKITVQGLLLTSLAITSVLVRPSFAGDEELIKKLKEAKLSLVQGIAYAEKKSGPVTSAKFEVKNGNLLLSIYTAPQGLNTSPELTDLTELNGLATTDRYEPEVEVFSDKAHIARASVHLSVMQLSKYALTQIIEIALKAQSGVPYSVKNPMIRNGKAVADVFIANNEGRSVRVTINVQTGDVVVN